MSAYRMKRLARYARGLVLDAGYANIPNRYLAGTVIGFDIQHKSPPANYAGAVTGDVREFSFAGKTFDTILAGELIEHLEEPIDFLRECYTMLRPNGRLVLSTPNPYYPPYILLNWLLYRKYFYSDDHLFAFTPRLMMRLCERTGFVVEHVISGGVVLPLLNESIPFPRPICYHMIYVCRK